MYSSLHTKKLRRQSIHRHQLLSYANEDSFFPLLVREPQRDLHPDKRTDLQIMIHGDADADEVGDDDDVADKKRGLREGNSSIRQLIPP